jgi:WD40 repeat protein
MKRLFAVMLTSSLLGFALVEPASAAEPTYWQDVRPILRKHCTVCHSVRNVRELEVSGGLVMDTYDTVVKNQKKPLVASGKSGDSFLIHIITTTDLDKRMPLGGKALPDDALAVLKNWIDTGAKEGTRPETEAAIVVVKPPSRTRKLPVVLTTTTTPPSGAFGSGTPAPLQLALPVGPLAPIAAVVFSPDGKLLATGAYGRVTVWDMATLQPVKTLTNVLGAVNDLRFSPDGKLLAVSGGQPSAKGDLRLYSVADWKLLAVLGGHEDVVNSVAFSSDGKRLASASFDKTVRVWDLTTFKQEKAFTDHSDFVYAVAFAPDGQWIASASKDRSVKVFDLTTGKSRLTFSGMEQDVMAVAISPNGQAVVSSGGDPALFWWNPKTGDKVRTQSGHSASVQELCFSRNGKLVASAGGDGTLRTWDASNGKPLRSMPVGSLVYACGFSPDGKIAVTGSFDGLVRLWDVDTGRLLVTLLSLPSKENTADWLALTPVGYTACSSLLKEQTQWRMGAQTLTADSAWKVFAKPALVQQTVRGEMVPPPFPK